MNGLIDWRRIGTALAFKTAADNKEIRRRNKEWLDQIRMKKHEVEICGIDGKTIKKS